MHKNIEFREFVKDRFKQKIKDSYFPDQKYINILCNSLDKVEANSFSDSFEAFLSVYKSLKDISIKVFVDGCLNQLLWINTILESQDEALTEEDLEEKFDYKTPTMESNYWILIKVTKKGVYFQPDFPLADSRIVINNSSLLELVTVLHRVVQHNFSPTSAKDKEMSIDEKKSNLFKEDNTSTLFLNEQLENDCLKVLKEIKHSVLDVNGWFLDEHGMKGAIANWYNFCKVEGFISKTVDTRRDNIAKEIMKIIPNLSIDGSTLEKEGKAKKYKLPIESKIKELVINYKKEQKKLSK